MKPADIRNIAIVGHSSTGKTTLVDWLAWQAKAVPRLGKVGEGNSISDYQPDEIEKKISLYTSLVSFEYKSKKLNFLDTPGFQDFIGETLGALRAVDIALIVLGADQGVQFSTKRYIKESQKNGLCKIFFINRLDKEQTDFDTAFEGLKSHLKSGVVPLEIPIGSGPGLKGVVNLLTMKAVDHSSGEEKEIDIPADMKSDAAEYRQMMMDAVAEADDTLIEKYLESGTLTDDELLKGFVKGMTSGKLSAVLCGAAEKGIGVLSLLEILSTVAPSPADRQTVSVTDQNGNKAVDLAIDPAGPFVGFVFKTMTEPHVGDLNFVRVWSGMVRTGMDVKDTRKNSSERVGQVFSFLGKEKKETKEAVAGDICVLVKLKDVATGDTICDMKSSFLFPAVEFPKPLIDIAIVPKDKADEDKMGTSLHKLLAQDPTLKMRTDSELKQTIISGMGEQQIENLRKQLQRKFNVNIELERPKVAYRETIKKSAKAQGRHKKQSGGHGQYGDCWLELQPLPLNASEDFVFEDNIFGGSIPSKFIPSVEKGVIEAMNRGVISGHKVIKVKCIVYDGSYHDVDSSDIAFQIAGSLGFRNAVELASPVVLEPINRVKIFISNQYVGDVIGDLNGRRGKISGMDDEEEMKIISSFVPDAEMYKYANILRSMTQGTGTFEMEFDHYEEVPHDISKKIVDQYQKLRAEHQGA